MRHGVGRMPRVAAAMAVTAVLAACASSNAPSSEKAARGAPHPPTPAADDWRALMMLPFGTLLKDVPYPLGEIVVFHDTANEAGAGEDRDCYTLREAAPPRFFGRQVDEYSLCFSRDRLNRVEASVSLPEESASAQFTAACAEWQRRGAPAPGTGAADTGASDRCEFRDGATEVDARLATSEGSAAPAVSIALVDAAPVRGAGP
jgi:hypothetical protein